jgi:transposase
MPIRSFDRQQAWLFPPTLDELIPDDHPVRFIAEFVDSLDQQVWFDLEIKLEGESLGAPAYHPKALLSIWLYGFMTGIRSSRKLEAACRDQIPYLWLTGWQHPDHNTLWRFYKAHRQPMRKLLKQTVVTAVELKLIDLAVQAVDGTKIAANAARDRNYDANELLRLMERTDKAIAAMEAQNEQGNDPSLPKLPEELQKAKVLREKIKDALIHLEENKDLKRVNTTDHDAQLMKGIGGIITGYNAQAMVSPFAQTGDDRDGMLITASDVVNAAADSGQLIPMLEQAEELTGERVSVTLADGGYHTAANLEAGHDRGQTLVMAERYGKAQKKPYFKDQFIYNPDTDSYLCPQGHYLYFKGLRRNKGDISKQIRVYRASRTDCRTCSAYGICTRDTHAGRALWIGPSDMLIRKHRQWMKTEEARSLYAWRKQLIEPVFGIIKEQIGVRRFLLRGLVNVKAEFTLLATAFNLKMLARVWSQKKQGIQSLIKQTSLYLLRLGLFLSTNVCKRNPSYFSEPIQSYTMTF